MKVQTDKTSEATTIRISAETRERLLKLGSMPDSYDDVIKRLLDKIDQIK